MRGDQIGASRADDLRRLAAGLVGQVKKLTAKLECVEQVNPDTAVRTAGRMMNLAVRLDGILSDLPPPRRTGRRGRRP